jgi:NADPH2:quinone reductase
MLTTGKGVDVVIDMVGGTITGDALSALAKFGILSGIGHSAGTEFTAKMTEFVWKTYRCGAPVSQLGGFGRV